ncbi:MAG: hypothetical protein HQL70_00435 [Magnetococcales bacterium]|nr:hypothetical protein [Magnetococcales bacterium]
MSEQRPSFAVLAGWSIGILVALGVSGWAPWSIFIHFGPHWGLLSGLLLVIPWALSVKYEPAGIKLGPFATPVIFNFFGLLIAWILKIL